MKMPRQHPVITLELGGKVYLGFDETSSATFLIRTNPIKHQNFSAENLREP